MSLFQSWLVSRSATSVSLANTKSIVIFDEDEDEIVPEFVVFPHLYIAADTDIVDHVVGMVEVVPSPTPRGSNDDIVDQSLDESHLASGTTAVCHKTEN